MPDRFHLAGDGIAWAPARGQVPHRDHVEMSGRAVSLVLSWEFDARLSLRLVRRIYWPTLRGAARQLNGYLCREIADDLDPAVMIDGVEQRLATLRAAEVAFDGIFTVRHRSPEGLEILRRIFPHPSAAAVCERWTLRNGADRPLRVELGEVDYRRTSRGCAGSYEIRCRHAAMAAELTPGQTFETGFAIAAGVAAAPAVDPHAGEAGRRARIAALATPLRFASPDPAVDRLFAFACLRAGEALFDTKQGLVHSPCGNSFYGGIWANDQVEYAGPFFPHLGDADAIHASVNAYRIFARAMGPDYAPIPSSFEIEGDRPVTELGDRGDAAMYLSGCSRFLLALGDRALAEELWPALAWCAEYCRRQTDDRGVVRSRTDELEGRFPTGDANLSTSTLAWDGLRHAARLARDLGRTSEATELAARAEALAGAIERHFAAEVEGFPTWRYFDGCTVLRSWISLPLALGLDRRVKGTLDALFSPRLWTPDGLATQAGDTTFWDRATLYGLRGACAAGAQDRALPYLTAYARRRLLGDHVPYPVEAWPEGGQAHLSAEAALFARIITEGLFGLEHTGLGRAQVRPRLPAAWPSMRLDGLAIGGRRWSIAVERAPSGLQVAIAGDGGERRHGIAHGEPVALDP